MKTNREKYEHYCAIFTERDAAAVKVLLPDGVPAQFFTIEKYEARPFQVTGIQRGSRRGFYHKSSDSRITKQDVVDAQTIAENWSTPTLDDIYVHYTYQQSFGRVSGAFEYPKIGASDTLKWTAEELQPEIERQHALYSPLEGHQPCQYCLKQTPEGSLVERKIFYRDQGGTQTKIGKYCTDQCGYYDQCGHEG